MPRRGGSVAPVYPASRWSVLTEFMPVQNEGAEELVARR